MNLVWTAIATGITSFIATNIDDIVILMLFFSQLNRQFTVQQIVGGQYLGFTCLLIASLIGFLGGLILPKTVIGLLGFLPIAIGIKGLFQAEKEKEEIQGVAFDSLIAESRSAWKRSLGKVLNTPLFNVAAVTVANGGDNIGIYIPLFANSNLLSLGIILIVFYILIGVWCAIAYFLTRHPILAQFLTQYGEKITPYILIALGIFILIESESYHLLPKF
ncbi:cadmium resistance transporter [Planktothrix pseudagardhii]|uniref:Cadmium resistance transporter n=1 Tax=Planktothrix pseudagardhii TaxID=132604 RepID=A0A9W4CL11_9CYAN|nr:cadmium resistance transporter [Planktothrix pseudagardhii]CAD5950222.1 Cadmium resistance transporter [Planktothrix pseudagardhii]